MGGGWTGYIFVFAGCGVVLAIVGVSTLVLYAMARVKRRDASRLRVVSLGAGDDDGNDAG